MNIFKRLAKDMVLVSLLFSLAGSVSAATVIFHDDFTSDTPGLAVSGSLNNWNIDSGNLDVLGPGVFQSLCKNGTGQCLDMAGTNSNSSISTSTSFLLAPGEYLFEFEYANNSTSNNFLNYIVSGFLNDTVFANLSNGVFTKISESFTVNSPVSVTLSFIGGGPLDNGGAVLEYATLTQTSDLNSVPVPMAFWLFVSGLFSLSALKRRFQ